MFMFVKVSLKLPVFNIHKLCNSYTVIYISINIIYVNITC